MKMFVREAIGVSHLDEQRGAGMSADRSKGNGREGGHVTTGVEGGVVITLNYHID
jgi:hypothetical protein